MCREQVGDLKQSDIKGIDALQQPGLALLYLF